MLYTLNSHDERLNDKIERRQSNSSQTIDDRKGSGHRGSHARTGSSKSGTRSGPVRRPSTTGSTTGTSSSHPLHLSEFYSFMNNKSNIPLSPTQSTASKTDREPPLHTFTSFLPSVMDLPNIVATKDFNHNVNVYKNLLSKAEGLRNSLLMVSSAANEFGQALEDCINECPKVHNSKVVSDGLINAGGLQYMIGSNQQILSRLIETNFEDPLRGELDRLCREYDMNHVYYQQEIKHKSKLLREKELENIKLSKLKTRNLNTYKNNLLHLTNHLEEIDRLKYDYYHEINSMIESFNQNHLLIRTGSLVRAQLEIFEGIAKKGWSGGGLDDLLSISPDLFDDNIEGIEEGDDTVDVVAEEHSDPEPESEPEPPISPSKTHESKKEGDLEEAEDVQSTQNSTRVSESEPLRQSSPDHMLTKLTNSFSTILRSTEPDTSNDESFSLPVVNQASLLRSKSDNEASPESIDKKNILDELDT